MDMMGLWKVCLQEKVYVKKTESPGQKCKPISRLAREERIDIEAEEKPEDNGKCCCKKNCSVFWVDVCKWEGANWVAGVVARSLD